MLNIWGSPNRPKLLKSINSRSQISKIAVICGIQVYVVDNKKGQIKTIKLYKKNSTPETLTIQKNPNSLELGNNK